MLGTGGGVGGGDGKTVYVQGRIQFPLCTVSLSFCLPYSEWFSISCTISLALYHSYIYYFTCSKSCFKLKMTGTKGILYLHFCF
jgi:hypothetical protein